MTAARWLRGRADDARRHPIVAAGLVAVAAAVLAIRGAGDHGVKAAAYLAAMLVCAFAIVPIGLTWSYMTLRTDSFWPALLAHGFNVWGLRNPSSG